MNKNSTLSDMSFEDPIQKINDEENNDSHIDYNIKTDDEDEPKKTKTPIKKSQKKNKKEENNIKKKISKYQIHDMPIKFNKENDYFKLNKNHVIFLLSIILASSIFFNIYFYKKRSD